MSDRPQPFARLRARLTRPQVLAAGGVVWRRRGGAGDGGGGGDVEVLLVHRPRKHDWSLPKGKLEPGERFEEAAVREVEEETGVSARMGAELPSVRYRDAKGRPKLVRYWAMTVEREVERPADHEVDEVRWLSRDQARERLTYPHDRTVLDALDPST